MGFFLCVWYVLMVNRVILGACWFGVVFILLLHEYRVSSLLSYRHTFSIYHLTFQSLIIPQDRHPSFSIKASPS